MSARHRERTYARSGGTATNTYGVGPAPSSWSETEYCDDVVGNYQGENPFFLVLTSNALWSVGGKSKPTGNSWTYNGYVRNRNAPGYFPVQTSEPTNNQTLSEALARTNPNRTYVDLPVFLFELKDIPRMVQTFSKLFMQKYPRQHIRESQEVLLSYEYGAKPFYDDLCRMMDFVNQTDKRFRELKNLQTKRSGYGRIWTSWRDYSYDVVRSTPLTPLYAEDNLVTYQLCTTREKWASTRWIPQVDLSIYDDNDLRRLANRLVFGWDITFSTLWEAMPWSWLIDWYSNVGDLIAAERNTVPVKHDGSCVMRRVVTRLSSAKITSGSGVSSANVSIFRAQNKTLLRTVMTAGPLPEFNLPLLSGRQLSILGAISVTRFVPIS